MSDSRVVDADEWKQLWNESKLFWHLEHVHPLLEKHANLFTPDRKKLSIFVPFCGKSVDMKWLAESGHNVTGVELYEVAIKQFAEEQNISFTEEPLSDGEGTKYTSFDGKITCYACDFFIFSRHFKGRFDAVWDRGGFMAVNIDDRNRYVKQMASLMNQDSLYLLMTVQFDQSKYQGPPHATDESTVCNVFGGHFECSILDTWDAFTESKRSWGIDSYIEVMYILHFKETR